MAWPWHSLAERSLATKMPRWITGSNRLHPPHDSSKDDGDDEDTAAGTMALMPVLVTAREADAAAAIPPSARLATLGELSCAGGEVHGPEGCRGRREIKNWAGSEQRGEGSEGWH